MTRRNRSQAPVRDTAHHRLAPRLVTGVVLGALAIVFVIENRQQIDVRLLVPVVTMPLWTALAALLLIGVLVGLLLRARR
jgi:uncharacterized integral membrane protein